MKPRGHSKEVCPPLRTPPGSWLLVTVTIHGHSDPKNKIATGEMGLGAKVRNRAGSGTCASHPRSLSVAVFDIMEKGKLGREGLI